jgi:hypothetical protein
MGLTLQRANDINFTQGVTNTNLGNVSSYSYTSVTPGSTYYYHVRASSGTIISPWSNIVTVVTPSLPPAPTNFTGNGVIVNATTASIVFNWQESATVNGFTIQRGSDANFTQVLGTSTLGATATTYTSTGRSRGTTYYYRIRANITGLGSSAWVNVTVTTP